MFYRKESPPLNNQLFVFFPLIAALGAMIISQTIKLIMMLLSGKGIHWVTLTRSGGMPSSHSALITAITLSVGLKEGFDSSFFFIATVLSLVVIYDARGIRHAVGKHAQILNQQRTPTQKKLNEQVGHTLPEIIVGISIGILVSLGMYHLINF